MAGNSDEQLEYECVSLLKEFGLSEYEAYTFVYLLRLGSGTAKDVADVDGVPEPASTTRLTHSTRPVSSTSSIPRPSDLHPSHARRPSANSNYNGRTPSRSCANCSTASTPSTPTPKSSASGQS